MEHVGGTYRRMHYLMSGKAVKCNLNNVVSIWDNPTNCTEYTVI
jgi:hypothetical protein